VKKGVKKIAEGMKVKQDMKKIERMKEGAWGTVDVEHCRRQRRAS
jgi:hypothetical protein